MAIGQKIQAVGGGFKEKKTTRNMLGAKREGLQRSKNNREIMQGDDGMIKVPRYVQIMMKEGQSKNTKH